MEATVDVKKKKKAKKGNCRSAREESELKREHHVGCAVSVPTWGFPRRGEALQEEAGQKRKQDPHERQAPHRSPRHTFPCKDIAR